MAVNSLSVLEHAHIADMQKSLKQKLQESSQRERGDFLSRPVLAAVVGDKKPCSKAKF
mgnify:CR=1 FL=1